MVKCGTFMKRILIQVKKFLKSHSTVFIIISLLVLVAISYGQTVFMYFLIDDNALIYKLQHFNQNIGLFGKGLSGEGPYRHVVNQFIPFYPIFKTNPMPYFAVGVLLYFFSAVTFYLFVRFFTKNHFIAFWAAAIFASGYVGSEAMFGIFNSWQTTRGIIMLLSTFWLFYKFINSRKLIFYILSIILFFFSLDTVYIRAHGLIFAIFFFDLLFWPVVFKLSSTVGFIARQIPFWFIHYRIYLESAAFAREFGIFHILRDIFIEKKIILATIPIQDIGNLFIPDLFTSKLDSIISQSIPLPSEFSLGSFIAGVLVSAFFIYITIKNFQRKNFLVRILIFSFIFSIANFIVFWMRETSHTLWTTHRYFLYSFVGVSLFWSTSFYVFIKQVRIFSLAVIVIYLWLGVNYQNEFNEKRSFPAKKFFTSFENSVPNIPKDAVVYFDLVNDNKIRGEFGNFFGGIFSEGSNLAIYSEGVDYMTDFIFTYKFDDITEALEQYKTTIDKVFTFYYGDNGLIDTSQKTRELLAYGEIFEVSPSKFSSNTPFTVSGDTFSTKTLLMESGGKTTGENPRVVISIPEDTPSFVPSLITFYMSVTPLPPPLPYEGGERTFSVSSTEKSKIFSYLLSQGSFRKNTVATSASFWKEQEPKFLIDGRLETSWRGHRGFWDEIDRGRSKETEFLQVDLKEIKRVGKVIWVSAQKPLVPTHYKILTSLDGNGWELAKEVIRGTNLPEGTVISDSFSPKQVRFIKMEILKTFGNDGPEIKEFEVVEEKYKDLDQKSVEQVRDSPFARIENMKDLNDAISFIKQNAILRLYYRSSADSKRDPVKYVDIPVKVYDKFHKYQVALPATGISWINFTLDGFNFPVEIVIEQTKLIYQSIKN